MPRESPFFFFRRVARALCRGGSDKCGPGARQRKFFGCSTSAEKIFRPACRATDRPRPEADRPTCTHLDTKVFSWTRTRTRTRRQVFVFSAPRCGGVVWGFVRGRRGSREYLARANAVTAFGQQSGHRGRRPAKQPYGRRSFGRRGGRAGAVVVCVGAVRRRSARTNPSSPLAVRAGGPDVTTRRPRMLTRRHHSPSAPTNPSSTLVVCAGRPVVTTRRRHERTRRHHSSSARTNPSSPLAVCADEPVVATRHLRRWVCRHHSSSAQANLPSLLTVRADEPVVTTRCPHRRACRHHSLSAQMNAPSPLVVGADKPSSLVVGADKPSSPLAVGAGGTAVTTRGRGMRPRHHRAATTLTFGRRPRRVRTDRFRPPLADMCVKFFKRRGVLAQNTDLRFRSVGRLRVGSREIFADALRPRPELFEFLPDAVEWPEKFPRIQGRSDRQKIRV